MQPPPLPALFCRVAGFVLVGSKPLNATGKAVAVEVKQQRPDTALPFGGDVGC